MGAFFLYKKNEDAGLKAAESAFKERGFSEPKRFDLGDLHLLLYKKIAVDHTNYFSHESASVFVTGTLVYKQLPYAESIRQLLIDRINGVLDTDELLGHFAIIFQINGQLSFVTDRAGTYNLFQNTPKTILSSSFLAVASSSTQKLSLDKNAMVEILTTGSLIGPATIFSEIKKIGPGEAPLPDVLKPDRAGKTPAFNSARDFDDALQQQINSLDTYFKASAALADSVGVDSGLTGGFDSRLIYILATKHYKNVSFHSHWRKTRSFELECAEKICETDNRPLTVVPVTYPADMSAEKLSVVLNESYHFYDGQIRSHCYWTEEYNTLAYRKSVIKGNGLGLHGIGGEQYRNEERMAKKWNASEWIRYDLLYRYSGDCFSSPEEKESFYLYYKEKIAAMLDIQLPGKVNHGMVKKFLNEVYIPANRATRTNAENAVMFFLSPFADYKLSHKAYEAVPYLGLSTEFQKEIIKTLNPRIASVMSDYGYDFYKGEPLSSKLVTLVKDAIPKAWVYKMLHKRKASANDDSYAKLEQKFPVIREYESCVAKLNLPLNLDYLKKKADLSPLIISMGYVLKKFEHKITWN